MRAYIFTLLLAFLILFSACYAVPCLRNLAHFFSLSAVVIIMSHYFTLKVISLAAYKVVSSTGKIVVITRCDSGYGNRLAIELDRRGFTVSIGTNDHKHGGEMYVRAEHIEKTKSKETP